MGLVKLDDRSYVHCLQCGLAISFPQGQEHPPETKVIEVASDTVITMMCPTDGKFEVSAGDFRNDLSNVP